MVTVDFSGTVYKLTDDQANLLAENLRNYARGTFPAYVNSGPCHQGQGSVV